MIYVFSPISFSDISATIKTTANDPAVAGVVGDVQSAVKEVADEGTKFAAKVSVKIEEKREEYNEERKEKEATFVADGQEFYDPSANLVDPSNTFQ